MVANVKCYLCERGEPTGVGGKGHGVTIVGLCMLDTTCPITEDEFKKLVDDIKEAAQTAFHNQKVESDV